MKKHKPKLYVETVITKEIRTSDNDENVYHLPIVDFDSETRKHRFVGVLLLVGERPEMYSKSRNRITSAKVGHHLGDVFTLPGYSEFVCFAEGSIVYQLPKYPDNDPDEGLREIIIPYGSTFYHISECEMIERTVNKTYHGGIGQ